MGESKEGLLSLSKWKFYFTTRFLVFVDFIMNSHKMVADLPEHALKRGRLHVTSLESTLHVLY